jgi:hypothetical protein
MEAKNQPYMSNQELLKKLKLVLIINDYVKTKSENIDEFNLSKINLSYDIQYKGLVQVFESFKHKKYQKTSNLNRKTQSFINLMDKISNSDPKSNLFNVQLSLAYYLVYMYHNGVGQDDKKGYMKTFTTFLFCFFNNNICLQYLSILRHIKLLINENINDSDSQFQNKCEMIINLDRYEFNSNLSSFLLKNEAIPQYKKISFPKLYPNDNENIYNMKIEKIANLLDVIKSSLTMNIEDIRFELFKKYMNQLNKLDAVNQVLSFFDKKKLISLSEGEFEQYIELYKEHSIFYKRKYDKSEEEISKLNNELTNYRQAAKILTNNLEKSQNKLKELMEERKSNREIKEKYDLQTKEFDKIYDKLQNVKYRDISTFIIDYFICLLNDSDYDFVMNSTYRTAVDFIIKEINTDNYSNYKRLLLNEGISLGELLNVLIEHKFEFNSVTHDSAKIEEEFIRLIIGFKNEEMGRKFQILFEKTPLLKTFCFVKRNEITRAQIRNTISGFKK